MEETISNREITSSNKTQGDIIDINKGEVTQGNMKINQTHTEDPNNKNNTKENLEKLV